MTKCKDLVRAKAEDQARTAPLETQAAFGFTYNRKKVLVRCWNLGQRGHRRSACKWSKQFCSRCHKPDVLTRDCRPTGNCQSAITIPPPSPPPPEEEEPSAKPTTADLTDSPPRVLPTIILEMIAAVPESTTACPPINPTARCPTRPHRLPTSTLRRMITSLRYQGARTGETDPTSASPATDSNREGRIPERNHRQQRVNSPTVKNCDHCLSLPDLTVE